MRSHATELHHQGSCRDVGIVTMNSNSSTSVTDTSLDTFDGELSIGRRIEEISFSRMRSQGESSVEYDSGHESAGVSTTNFEFQKAPWPVRGPLGSLSRPVPSKWDDAEKWIASPQLNRPRTGQLKFSQEVAAPQKTGAIGCGNQEPVTKVVIEVTNKKLVAFEEIQTKRVNSRVDSKEFGGKMVLKWVPEPCPSLGYGLKPELTVENPVANSAVGLCQQNSSLAVHTTTAFVYPPSTIRSVSMRDTGTEMTPIASKDPSRTGTPVRTTPFWSPSSSKPQSPRRRTAPTSSPVGTPDILTDSNKDALSKSELVQKTRREIMALGTQLGKMNIAAWASKEEEDKDASTSLKTISVDQPHKSVIESRASAWEDAEKAKYIARYKREEIKIQAWENHQKAKTEAEMRKVEVEIERMRGRAHDKLMNKLAAARHNAEEKHAAAEAKRNKRAAKTEQQAEYIWKTGRIPTSFSCWSWCS